MIKINFVEPTDSNWTDWKTRCKTATDKLIKDVNDGKSITITNLYKEKKNVFFKHDDYFYGKCVFCESLITNTHPGDVEHFRPKGKVTDLDNKTIKVTANGSAVDHPGYYWLAYEILNLMPACEDCNRPSSGNSGGKKIGKWMKFPVNGKHAFKPGDEILEDPILINPVVEDPSNHLRIDKLGIIHPVENSVKGRTCIEVFGLNDRSSLVNERKEMYKQVKNEVMLAFTSIIHKSPDSQERLNSIQDHRNGKRPYTLAAKKAIEDEKDDCSKIYEI